MSRSPIDDIEITRELWQSRLPICFILSDEDISRFNPSKLPEPLYLMLSRHLYFPCFIEKICRYYSINLTESTNNISLNNLWLEYENIPLKWHYPIGVLYDLYTSSHLPWEIIVHLNKFPENELIRFPDKDSIEAHYMSTLKEADALKHKGQIIGDMQKRDHKQLWYSLLQDKYEGFWNINTKLMSYTDNLQYFRYIPFRIYIFDKPFLQKLFSPYDIEENKWLTLNDLIQFSLTQEAQCEQLAKMLKKNIADYRIIIHGIQLPLHTPVQWLSEYFSYPDNFLHICLIEKRISVEKYFDKIRMMEKIRSLYEKHGDSEYYGEQVSQYEHALQAAYFAEQYAPNDHELIIAALLHDIGHLLGKTNEDRMGNLGVIRHESVGAKYLRTEIGLSERICYLVENHVNAKRYLTYIDHDYYHRLSDASKQTLVYQGGPMNNDEAEAFRLHKEFELCLRMRTFDEAAKDTHFKDYEEKMKKYWHLVDQAIHKN